MRRRLPVGWFGMTGVAIALVAAAPLHAEKTAAPPKIAQPVATEDDELLEFLGGAGGDLDDQDWLDFLSNTDIRRIAGAKK